MKWTREVLDASTAAYSRYVEYIDDQLDSMVEGLWLNRKQISCKKGCSFCCYYKVLIGAPDAFRIALKLRSHGLDTGMLRARLRRVSSAFGSGSRAFRCAFLAGDGTCSIYEDRPLACRMHLALNEPERCDDVNKGVRTELSLVNAERFRVDATERMRVFAAMAGMPEEGLLSDMVLRALVALEDTDEPGTIPRYAGVDGAPHGGFGDKLRDGVEDGDQGAVPGGRCDEAARVEGLRVIRGGNEE